MTLAELIEACQHRTGFSDSAYRPRWLTFINQAVREFARRQPWDGLEDTVTLKTDGTEYLVMPHFVDTVISLLNVTDSLPIDRDGDWEKTAPGVRAQRTAGRPSYYDKAGDVATTKDPAGYLWFRSSHASDYSSLYVTGLVQNSGASGALERTFKELSVSASGTTPVTLSQLFLKIFSIAKSTDSNGDFFFYDAGASNSHVSFLSAHDNEARFRRIQLLFKPDSQRSIDVRFRYKIPKLTENAQAPHPAVKSDFIIEHSIALHWAEQEQLSKAGAAEQKANRVLDAEANKEENFNEPNSRFLPWLPAAGDVSDDFYRGW